MLTKIEHERCCANCRYWHEVLPSAGRDEIGGGFCMRKPRIPSGLLKSESDLRVVALHVIYCGGNATCSQYEL